MSRVKRRENQITQDSIDHADAHDGIHTEIRGLQQHKNRCHGQYAASHNDHGIHFYLLGNQKYMVQYLNAGADKERTHIQKSQNIEFFWVLCLAHPESEKGLTEYRQERNGDTDNKYHNAIRAGDNLQQLFLIFFCIGNRHLRVKDARNGSHQIRDYLRNLGRDRDGRHGR